MKHINKMAEPSGLTNFKNANPAASYDNITRHVKKWVKNALIKEQKGICCYCECRIDADNSHIEHFRPKGNSLFQHLSLDYNNMHACCIREKTRNDENMHCGHFKGEEFSNNLISPLEMDCANHFKYSLNGEIQGVDDRGIYTVQTLHLDSAALSEQRKQLIEYFQDLDDTIRTDEITNHLDNTKAQLGEFFTMVEQLQGVI